MEASAEERAILRREEALRAWFVRGCGPARQVIDGLDIGWGGVQRWATGRMPAIADGLHLDFACGYGTFLAQLGWRFPEARLVGLNIDFRGPHALAQPQGCGLRGEGCAVGAASHRSPEGPGTTGGMS